MSRLPATPREQLSSEQQECHDLFERKAEPSFGPNGERFIYINDDGGYTGPFPFYIALPKVGIALYGLLMAMAECPLPADARETAIMTIGGLYQAEFETYSHRVKALEAGLTADQVEMLTNEHRAEGLNAECSIACDVARYLALNKGPLPQNLWDKSLELLGKDSTVTLLHYVGMYSYIAVALNGVDAGGPPR